MMPNFLSKTLSGVSILAVSTVWLNVVSVTPTLAMEPEDPKDHKNAGILIKYEPADDFRAAFQGNPWTEAGYLGFINNFADYFENVFYNLALQSGGRITEQTCSEILQLLSSEDGYEQLSNKISQYFDRMSPVDISEGPNGSPPTSPNSGNEGNKAANSSWFGTYGDYIPTLQTVKRVGWSFIRNQSVGTNIKLSYPKTLQEVLLQEKVADVYFTGMSKKIKERFSFEPTTAEKDPDGNVLFNNLTVKATKVAGQEAARGLFTKLLTRLGAPVDYLTNKLASPQDYREAFKDAARCELINGLEVTVTNSCLKLSEQIGVVLGEEQIKQYVTPELIHSLIDSTLGDPSVAWLLEGLGIPQLAPLGQADSSQLEQLKMTLGSGAENFQANPNGVAAAREQMQTCCVPIIERYFYDLRHPIEEQVKREIISQKDYDLGRESGREWFLKTAFKSLTLLQKPLENYNIPMFPVMGNFEGQLDWVMYNPQNPLLLTDGSGATISEVPDLEDAAPRKSVRRPIISDLLEEEGQQNQLESPQNFGAFPSGPPECPPLIFWGSTDMMGDFHRRYDKWHDGVWNHQFKNTLGGALPDGWKYWNRSASKPEFKQKRNGEFTGTGDCFGIYHTLDLSRFIGKTVEFTANIKSDNPGPCYKLEAHEEVWSSLHKGNKEWEYLSMRYVVEPADSYVVYFETKQPASFTMNNLNIKIQDTILAPAPEVFQNEEVPKKALAIPSEVPPVEEFEILPPVPQWNHQLKNTLGGSLPDGWNFWSRSASNIPVFQQEREEGELTGTGDCFGIYHTLDLSQFIGKTVEFTADIKSDKPGPYYKLETTNKEVCSSLHNGNNEWENLSMRYVVVEPADSNVVYFETKQPATFTIKNLKIKIQDTL